MGNLSLGLRFVVALSLIVATSFIPASAEEPQKIERISGWLPGTKLLVIDVKPDNTAVSVASRDVKGSLSRLALSSPRERYDDVKCSVRWPAGCKFNVAVLYSCDDAMPKILMPFDAQGKAEWKEWGLPTVYQTTDHVPGLDTDTGPKKLVCSSASEFTVPADGSALTLRIERTPSVSNPRTRTAVINLQTAEKWDFAKGWSFGWAQGSGGGYGAAFLPLKTFGSKYPVLERLSFDTVVKSTQGGGTGDTVGNAISYHIPCGSLWKQSEGRNFPFLITLSVGVRNGFVFNQSIINFKDLGGSLFGAVGISVPSLN
jgi:hypothetical protein